MIDFFRRRWRWVFGMALVCALLPVGPRRPSCPQPKITMAAFNQLRPGMTQAEMEYVLGYPRFDPSWRYHVHIVNSWKNAPQPDEVQGWRIKWWGEGEWVIQVFFEQEGRAFRAYFIHVSDSRDGWLEEEIALFRKLFGR